MYTRSAFELPKIIINVIERAIPVVIASTLVTVMLTTKTNLSGGLWPDTLFKISVATYVMFLFLLAFKPSKGLHAFLGPIGFFVFLTRGITFLQVVLRSDRFDLLGAFSERLLIASFVLLYHWSMIYIANGRRDG